MIRDWLTAPGLPAWAALTALHPRTQVDWAERWSWAVPPVSPGAIWLHGASLGEVGAACRLAGALPGPVLVTADTQSGAQRARQEMWSLGGRGVGGVRPVDHAFTLSPLFSRARPRAVLFVESSFWPGLASMAAGSGVPVIRVSATAGTGTRRAFALPGYRRLALSTSAVIARDAEAAEFYRQALGAPVCVGGDLKRGSTSRPPVLSWPRPFVVGGCTHAPEERHLARAVRAMSGFQMLLAPRYVDRVESVFEEVIRAGLRPMRLSQLSGMVPDECDVVVVDSTGVLAELYAGARAAFIGGTFDPRRGGHAPAEAFAAGVPVVCGPYTHANPLRPDDPAIQIHDLNELEQGFREAFTLAVKRTDDAVARTVELLEPWLGEAAAPVSPRPWARPLVPALAAATRLRTHLRGRDPFHLSVPVVATGGMGARGGGKTSLARWMARELANRGHTVGVVARGYKRSRAGRDVRVSWESTASADLGDEGALIASDGHLVAAGGDAVGAGRRLVDRGATIVVLDDGLSALELHRDVVLAIVDAQNPSANGPMPMGDGRGHLPNDLTGVVSMGGPLTTSVPSAPGAYEYSAWRPDAPSGPVTLACGVGRPEEVLSSMDLPLRRVVVVPDHHAGTAFLDGLADPLVCTAKDRFRWQANTHRTLFWRDRLLVVDAAPAAWFPPSPMAVGARIGSGAGRAGSSHATLSSENSTG